jgi:hypothetical protein
MVPTVTGSVSSIHSAFPRRVVHAAAVVLAALAALTTVLARDADASVNRYWPHHAFPEAGGRCTSYVGYNLNSSNRFIGSGEVRCDRAMDTISMKVTLFRAGSSFVASAWTPRYWNAVHIVDTPGACSGYTNWVARANIYIKRPDGSQYSVYRDAPLVNYDPPC